MSTPCLGKRNVPLDFFLLARSFKLYFKNLKPIRYILLHQREGWKCFNHSSHLIYPSIAVIVLNVDKVDEVLEDNQDRGGGTVRVGYLKLLNSEEETDSRNIFFIVLLFLFLSLSLSLSLSVSLCLSVCLSVSLSLSIYLSIYLSLSLSLSFLLSQNKILSVSD